MDKVILDDLIEEMKERLKCALDANDFTDIDKYSRFIRALLKDREAAKPKPKTRAKKATAAKASTKKKTTPKKSAAKKAPARRAAKNSAGKKAAE